MSPLPSLPLQRKPHSAEDKMSEELEEVEINFEEGFEEVNTWLRNEGYGIYKEARRLMEEESLEDPETDPFKSKYAARNIMSELKAKLEGFRNDDNPSEQLTILMSALDYQIGQNFLETEELSTGEEHVERCIRNLSEHRLNRSCSTIYLHALNELGILWSKRGDSEKSLRYFRDAEELYRDFTEEIGGSPYGMHE